jgi:hypothetical protein
LSLKISTIISFCSNDWRYLSRAIFEASFFSDDIVVPVCDHFFDGTKENKALLNRIFSNHPHVHFVQFAYDFVHLYNPFLSYEKSDVQWPALWHATSRYIGAIYAKENPYFLFTDVDEIVDGKKFKSWLEKETFTSYKAIRFSSYRYCYLASLRSHKIHHCSLLIDREQMRMNHVIQPDERYGMFARTEGAKKERVGELDPFFHHYSLVKTEKELIKKCQTWGHRYEDDWEDLIKKSFCKKIDFLFHEKFKTVVPFFDPLKEKLPRKIKSTPKVTYTDRHKVFRKMLDRETGHFM